MRINGVDTDVLLRIAVHCITEDPAGYDRALGVLPVPMYVTNPDGFITYFNQSCIEFAGRVPEVETDRWCVTAKLYTTTGEWLPHHQCPMAIAIKQRRPIRDVEAVAERPDGSRIPFQPYPTPILDADGGLIAAVNMLVAIGQHQHQRKFLRAESKKMLKRAEKSCDPQEAGELRLLASEYDARARALNRPQ